MYSVTEYAKATGLTRRAILKRIQKGQLNAVKVGSTYIIADDPAFSGIDKALKTIRNKAKSLTLQSSLPEISDIEKDMDTLEKNTKSLTKKHADNSEIEGVIEHIYKIRLLIQSYKDRFF